MTVEEFDLMVAAFKANKRVMVSPNRDRGVSYQVVGLEGDKVRLCGMPFAYEDYLIRNSFNLVSITDKSK